MRMLSTLAAIALLSTAASAALATQPYHPADSAEEGAVLRPHHMNDRTRTQVESEVLSAQRDGTLTNISRGYPARYPLSSVFVSGQTREQVLNDLRSWKTQPLRPDGGRLIPGVGVLEREAP